ncbi:MAG: acylphosphatase, partial [Bacteroidetes bacterium]|nr:acylphosphatase [Bacteroidota bacterium]
MSLKAIRLTIFGKVQGVGFRFYTQRKAQELNLTGWVKNQRDGTVYVEAEGENQAVDTFIDW